MLEPFIILKPTSLKFSLFPFPYSSNTIIQYFKIKTASASLSCSDISTDIFHYYFMSDCILYRHPEQDPIPLTAPHVCMISVRKFSRGGFTPVI